MTTFHRDAITGIEREARGTEEFACRYCGCWVHMATSEKTGKAYAADYKVWHGSILNTTRVFHPAHHCWATTEQRAEIDAERAAKRAEVEQAKADDEDRKQAARDAGVRVPTGKVTDAEVSVLTVYRKDRDAYGRYWKMIVVSDEGWRVWMTVPSALIDGDAPTISAGDRVAMTATIEASDDPIFGFAKRPAVTALTNA